MGKRILFVLVILGCIFSGGTLPSSLQRTDIRTEFAGLAKRGITYRMLDNEAIELTDPISGMTRVKSLKSVDEAAIRSWTTRRNVPIIEINPSNIDTSQYSGWFNYWCSVPLGNSTGGPLIMKDVDGDGNVEAFGAYLDTLSSDYGARCYEIDSLGVVTLRAIYTPRPGVARQFSDVNNNHLEEIDWSLSGVVSGYEQSERDSMPVHLLFAHNRYYHNSSPGYTGINICDLDGDDSIDFLYEGTFPSPQDSNITLANTFVAEFNRATNSFERVWSDNPIANSLSHGFSVGDFDNDGKMEFAGSRPMTGRFQVMKCTGNNRYEQCWEDSTGWPNFYYHGSGDIDGDGKPEFYIGATLSTGFWVVGCETDSNASYHPVVLFHLLSGGVLSEPSLDASDIDGDGRIELSMLVGSDLYVFKSSADNSYYLWFFRRIPNADAVTFCDINHDGRQELLISSLEFSSIGRGWLIARVFKASPLVSVVDEKAAPQRFELEQNYPNPFNPSTTITYDLPSRSHLTLKIFNLLGEEAATLVDGEVNAGKHSEVWNAAGMASGVYFCRLQTGEKVMSRKLLLVR
jgi:hypothetical protein